MSQSAILYHLKKIKARIPILQDRLEEVSKYLTNVYSSTIETAIPKTIYRILRILLRYLLDHYDYICHLGQDIVASRKVLYFELVDIRQYYNSNLEQSYILHNIQHPNIITVYDLYYDSDIIFLVIEHLDIYISELEF